MSSSSYSLTKINKFRKKYRQGIPWYYIGQLHLASHIILSLGLGTLLFFNIYSPTMAELSLIPISVLLANLTEYLFHRYPMHIPTKPIFSLYRSHTKFHHLLFTNNKMELDEANDTRMVLLPPRNLMILYIVLILPLGLLFYYLFSLNAAFIFAGTTLYYVVISECLHLSYHLPVDSKIFKIPLINYLKTRHEIHHRLNKMKEVNFSVFLPIFDFLLGTSYRGSETK